MTPSDCSQLDDFLAGALSPPEARAFEAHMRQCDACRGEAQAQQQLDQLLRFANERIEAPRLTAQIAAAARHTMLRRVSAWATAAAILLAGAVTAGWFLAWQRDAPPEVDAMVDNSPRRSEPNVSQPDPSPSPENVAIEERADPPLPSPVFVKPTTPDAIVLRVESEHPTIHIYRWLPAKPLAANQSRENSQPPTQGNEL